MPFTPLHMGPGIIIKAILQRHFSLMVFGWSQILIDVQPLMVMLTHKGHLHGFSHTYVGAAFIAIVAALSGKSLGGLGLKIIGEEKYFPIPWSAAWVGAFIGTYSHVLLDSIMHTDIQPFWPVSLSNSLQGIISIDALHIFCVLTAIVGGIIFYATQRWRDKVSNNTDTQ
jgi:membrane-bound metal-dependent hydrolase YbcI (DUF457 family)